MLYKKEGFPEESEVVLCTVLNVFHNTVFTVLDEYDRKGVIHISEISPGRIRNIRDFVVEGKKVLCKVLRLDTERGHIDLSLRRVTESQKRDKNAQLKMEQKAEKILELACKDAKIDIKQTYYKIKGIVFSKYSTLYSCFEDIVAGNFSVSELKIGPDFERSLDALIKSKIIPPQVEIRGSLKMESYEPDGIELIREALKRGKADDISIVYLGAGKFNVVVKAEDFKTAESRLKRSMDAITDYMESHKSKAEFARDEA
ncbi:MAG: S1 RNA-binding domain-containing protein [Candidatus Woesearchaeota archaeon]|nr:S1 RNA-binding domain-containing protein [Candidatus Woesearchaeota archaeon]